MAHTSLAEKILSFPDAEHERASPPRPKENPGNVRMDDRNSVGSDDLPQRFADGLHEAGWGLGMMLVEVCADQVGEHLGVGLGAKDVAPFLELSPQRKIVFDDAIVHEDEPATLVKMRMRVLVGHAPVSRPARVTDAQISVRWICRDHLGKSAMRPTVFLTSTPPPLRVAMPAES